MREKFYVGRFYDRRILFKSSFAPDSANHSRLYDSCVGPFKTKRGAEYFVKHHHIKTVALAEKLAKEEVELANLGQSGQSLKIC